VGGPQGLAPPRAGSATTPATWTGSWTGCAKSSMRIEHG
jgi:hypothetical protein